MAARSRSNVFSAGSYRNIAFYPYLHSIGPAKAPDSAGALRRLIDGQSSHSNSDPTSHSRLNRPIDRAQMTGGSCGLVIDVAEDAMDIT